MMHPMYYLTALWVNTHSKPVQVWGCANCIESDYTRALHSGNIWLEFTLEEDGVHIQEVERKGPPQCVQCGRLLVYDFTLNHYKNGRWIEGSFGLKSGSSTLTNTET